MTHTDEIAFIDFWLLVASELGDARLMLNKNAKTLDGFIDKNSDVRTYLHGALRQTYKLSQCENLRSAISLEHVLDTLGETAFQLQESKHGDLFDIELLEEIAWLICDRYAHQVSELVKRSAAWKHATQSTSVGANYDSSREFKAPEQRQKNKLNPHAQNGLGPRLAPVVSFPNFKIRKANAKL